MRSDLTIGNDPYADCWPMMDEETYKPFKEDIRINGVLESIKVVGETLATGLIIDGRNRKRACDDLGIDWTKHAVLIPESQIPNRAAFVDSMNKHRRHMTPSQLGIVAAKISKLPRGTNQHSIPQKEDASFEASSQSEAAKTLNISRSTVQRARKVIDTAEPSITEAVERGAISLTTAAKISELPKSEQKKLAKAGPEAIKEAAKSVEERPSRFNHDQFEDVGKDAKKKLAAFDAKLQAAAGMVKAVFDGLGVLIRGLDACGSHITNHPQLLNDHRQFTEEIEKAHKTAEMYVKHWNKGQS